MNPSQIGRYQILKKIGEGGFASVYSAYDPLLDTDVAIKVLADKLAVDGGIRSRFIDEARFLRRLAAPGLVAVHDIGEEGGLPYFVMEFCERGTLAERLEQMNRPVTVDEALQLARVIAAGVDVVHRAGIVHRDLKPSNFMIRRVDYATPTVVGAVLNQDEELVIGDFGLAKIVNIDASRLTIPGGTPGFSAPEQFSGDGSVDRTADVYAASAILVAAISGDAPQRVFVERDQAFTSEVMGSTGRFEPELARGLSFDRRQRHGTISDWYLAVEQTSSTNSTNPTPVSNELGIEQAVGPSPKPSAPGPLWKVPFRLDSDRNVAGLATAALIAALIVAGALGSGPPVLLAVLGYLIGVLVAHAAGRD